MKEDVISEIIQTLFLAAPACKFMFNADSI